MTGLQKRICSPLVAAPLKHRCTACMNAGGSCKAWISVCMKWMNYYPRKAGNSRQIQAIAIAIDWITLYIHNLGRKRVNHTTI